MQRRRVWVVVLATLFWIGLAPFLGAHSEVFERAPEMGQVVTGTVDHVDISFWAVIESGEITLVDPNGDAVDVGETALAPNGRISSVDFEPLTVEGRYTVTHSELSFDGDFQEASYSFVYNASEGDQVATLIARDTGPNWVLLGVIGGVILVLAGIFWPGRSAERPRG